MAFIQYRDSCNSCGALAGTSHNNGCDVARCAAHGIQHIQCGENCSPNTWTGYWAGELEAIEFGFFAHFVPNGNPSWQPCGPGHPEAVLDLNRVIGECEWNAATQRFVRRNKQPTP